MKRGLIWVAVLILLILPCRAEQLAEQFGTDKLVRAGQAYDVGVEFSDEMELDKELGGFFDKAMQVLPDLIRDALRCGLLLLAVVLLCAMAQSAQLLGTGVQMPVAIMAGALAVTGLSAGDVSQMLGLGRSTIDSMYGFGQVLMPVMAVCTAVAGGVGTAAARQVATSLFSNLLIAVIDRLLVPLVYAYVVAYTAYAAVGNPGLKRMAEFLRWTAKTALTVLLAAFVSYLTVGNAVAGNTDAAALKLTKTAISSAIPVVGGIISNAAETILVGAGHVRGSVGVFGLLAVLGLCLTPFLQLGVHYLCYKLSAAIAAMFAEGRLAELIAAIGTAFGLIFGMTGSCALVMLVSIISGISGVVT